MADSVDSASSSRANSAPTSTSDSAGAGGGASLAIFLWFQIETHEHAMFVGEVSNDASQRCGKLLDQGRNSDNLLVLGEHWLLKNVNHRQLVATFEVLLADRAQILHRFARSLRRAGDIQAQLVALRARSLDRG